MKLVLSCRGLLLGWCLAKTLPGFAQGRQVIPINDGWQFHFAYDTRRDAPKTAVTLPHTWNADEVMSGQPYYRGLAHYEKQLPIPAAYQGKRLFLRFEGANSVAHVFLNQRWVGEHRGGYTAFCLEITDRVQYGQDNLLTVSVSNAATLDVLPLAGDFNVYGGLHRPAALLVTEPDCITPLDYAAPGVFVEQTEVTPQLARLTVRTKLSVTGLGRERTLHTLVRDAGGKLVAEQTTPVAAGATPEVRQIFTLTKPHLWNGTADPYRYQVTAELRQAGIVADAVTQPLGLRFYRVDPDKGFFLNGKYLDLRGACHHQDVLGKGSALAPADQERDIELVRELGATALRLTHYPHPEYFYELCDKAGLVLWTEIPLVGPGGYTSAGYVQNPDLEAHGRQALTELIRQNYNHPAICFWGLFNELKLDYDSPVPYLQTLQALAKQEDPTRPTVAASHQDDAALNGVTDLIAWNKYYGWYGGTPAELGQWADVQHRQLPTKGIAVSEYGAGASIRQHTGTLRAPVPGGRFHPEGWQAAYHEGNWQQMSARPFLWGKFIWVLADFGSAIRREGDTLGINDKGVVTYDRQVKKDAFYFYKANWNPAPMLYLADRRHTRRTQPLTSVKAYTNLSEVELFLNGKSLGRQKPSPMRIVRWDQVTLQPGVNQVRLRSRIKGKTLEDSIVWSLE
ncbi:glycoside hydrolase family 2 TIM barrel-domain containing protein [Hymenobacter sp.]|uniref:glycoside hydrolase family 2 protein n=1 Tax=Hymenobacter sp. TaxID=1898978 RepID=UPI00286AF2BF|nr:glycoside hydrolase family 2 TIM barrel-domain containing protein [Hymenobacter sp.]